MWYVTWLNIVNPITVKLVTYHLWWSHNRCGGDISWTKMILNKGHLGSIYRMCTMKGYFIKILHTHRNKNKWICFILYELLKNTPNCHSHYDTIRTIMLLIAYDGGDMWWHCTWFMCWNNWCVLQAWTVCIKCIRNIWEFLLHWNIFCSIKLSVTVVTYKKCWICNYPICC